MSVICDGQRWVNNDRDTVIEVLCRDDQQPGRWLVLLQRSGMTVALSESEIFDKYSLSDGPNA